MGRRWGMLHANEDLMWQSVFAALDLVISTISPRKLLYLAADGVAPRAKMNQQRARRYRAAKSAREAAEAQARQLHAMANVIEVTAHRAGAQGTSGPNQAGGGAEVKGFDSNCISPGTEFMASFFRHLRFYCEKKFKEDARWRGLKVLLSGPDVPGEGEHKIMAYLRCCKAAGNADPNTRHCLYGLDADLIMLSLASHEPQFALLREEVVFGRPTTVDAADKLLREPEKLQLLHISLVREYLALDLLPAKIDYSQEQIAFRSQGAPPTESASARGSNKLNEPNESAQRPPPEGSLNLSIDKMLCRASETERVVDDFVIFCFLAGNDFLPHTFATDIGGGGLDKMILCYGRFLAEYRVLAAAVTSRTPPDGPWLVGRCGQLNLLNLYIFLKLFVETVEDYKVEGKAADMQWLMRKKGESMQTHNFFGGDSCKAYRASFYEKKLSMPLHTEEGRRGMQHLCRSYLEGLQWVAYYYFRGPDASGWRWYYPYHYAPFLRDIVECDIFKPPVPDTQRMGLPGTGAERRWRDLSFLLERTIQLPSGEPYSPFMQLLSILPPQSAALLPPQLGRLLTHPPPELAPFFPKDFEIDMEGVKVPWGGVALLPFVNEAVLERVVFPLLEKLPPEVLGRNGVGKIVLLMREETEPSWRKSGLLLCDKDSSICEQGQLASVDPVYDCECLFFKDKIVHRSLGVILDIPSLLKRINSPTEEGTPQGRERRQIRIFPSSLRWAFPDIVDSGVVEEEVLVLPPLVVARLEASKIVGVLRILRPTAGVPSASSQANIKDAVARYAETLRCVLQRTDLASLRPPSGPPISLDPLPKLLPEGDELLFPTYPLPGASPDAAALTPSLHSKCITWHRGLGVKVFKHLSTSHSIVLSVMPFPREELNGVSAPNIVNVTKPKETLNKVLSSKFVLYDYPFVRLASPVAVWLPTFYLPLEDGSTAQRAQVPTDPMEQLQEVETEKNRLRSQGVAVADEREALYFLAQQRAKTRTEQTARRTRNSVPYWDPEQQVLGGPTEDTKLECVPVQSLDQQLQRLAVDVTLSFAGTEQQRQSRTVHPETALSTLLVELRPVEDIVMEEKLVAVHSANRSSSGNAQEMTSTACVHYRYAPETVFRLLPVLTIPSKALVESMQHCYQEVMDAVEAHRKIQWKAGDDIFCVASDRQQQLRVGATGVLEAPPTSEDPYLSGMTYTLEEAAQMMGVSPFAAFHIFSSVFLKDEDNLYDCGLHIAIFTKMRKPAYVIRFSLPWPSGGSNRPRQSCCTSHLFTSCAVELGKQLVEAFPALGVALDSVGKRSPNIMTTCYIKATDVFRGLPDPAFLASRLASMAAQSPSRRAKAVTSEYACLWDRIYRALDDEREAWSEGLPRTLPVLLRVNEATVVPAADLLTIQKRIVSGSAGGESRSGKFLSVGLPAYVEPVTINLRTRRQLGFRGLSLKQGQQGTAEVLSAEDEERIRSQISAAERVALFQKQLDYLEDLCIEELRTETEVLELSEFSFALQAIGYRFALSFSSGGETSSSLQLGNRGNSTCHSRTAPNNRITSALPGCRRGIETMCLPEVRVFHLRVRDGSQNSLLGRLRLFSPMLLLSSQLRRPKENSSSSIISCNIRHIRQTDEPLLQKMLPALVRQGLTRAGKLDCGSSSGFVYPFILKRIASLRKW
ncbi:5'-3' exonuclease, putative [Eimeria brunetti]|uniref:5'-3' exonuclease, putative n=1 Tax=Eimeria brunetti TaxID=51314 RepID=U6LTL3_9EIME|nr:5'-3' exonuclease, putative [Eimeria brunetti]